MVFPDGPAAPEDPAQAQPRPRLWLTLVVGGVLMGVLLAAGVTAVARWYDASSPEESLPPRTTAALAELECGETPPAASVDPERTLDLILEPGEYPAPVHEPGAEAPVRVALVNVGPETVTLRAESDVAIVALQGGVVVGQASTLPLMDADAGSDPYTLQVPTGIGATVEGRHSLIGCDGEPLDAGEYALVAGIRLVLPDAEVTRELVSAPLAIAIG